MQAMGIRAGNGNTCRQLESVCSGRKYMEQPASSQEWGYSIVHVNDRARTCVAFSNLKTRVGPPVLVVPTCSLVPSVPGLFFNSHHQPECTSAAAFQGATPVSGESPDCILLSRHI